MTLDNFLVPLSSVIIKGTVYLSLPIIAYSLMMAFQRKLSSKTVGKMGRYSSRRRDYISFLQDLIKGIYKTPISYNTSSLRRISLSPAVAFGISVLPLTVIPICESFLMGNHKVNIEILSLNYSLLMFMALSSLHIFSNIIIGWGVNSNMSILSNLKKSMHFIGVEILLILIIINMIITYGSANFHQIVILQKKQLFWSANQLGIIIQPVLAIIYFYYLVFGSTFQSYKFSFENIEGQYGSSSYLNSIGLILLKLSDQVKFFVGGLVFSFLFLGGYGLVPGLSFLVEQYTDSLYFFQALSLIIKTVLVGFVAILIKQSIVNIRADQLMSYAWKNILPILYINTLGTIIYMIYTGKFKWV